MKEVLLKDISELIVDCPHSTAYDEGAGFPLVRTPNIGRGRLVYKDMHRVSEEVYNQRNQRAVPQEGDLIFAREAPAGNVALIQKGEKVCLGQRTVLIRPNKDLVNPAFLAYFLLAPQQQYNLLSTANGATVAHVNMPTIRNLKLSLPDRETQDRIASILSAYGDLITVNQRQISLLEEAAQKYYREWFVDLNFPGHETLVTEGALPSGWYKDTALNCFNQNITIGKTPPRAESKWFSKKDGLKWVSIADMGRQPMFITNTEERLTTEAVEKHNIRVLPQNAILLSFKLTIGKVSITSEPMCTNEAIAHFICPADYMTEYVFLYLKNFNFDTLGNTSSISKAINSKIVKGMPFIMPSQYILEQFHAKVHPIFDRIHVLQKMNADLTAAFDMLLPNLMNNLQ